MWVVIDHVPFKPRTPLNRVRIRTSAGAQAIIVPVVHPTPNMPIYRICIDNLPRWKQTLLDAITKTYGKSPYYDEYIDDFRSYILGPTVLLATLNLQTTLWLSGLMGNNLSWIHTREHDCSLPRNRIVDAVCQRLHAEPLEPSLSDSLEEDDIEEDLSVIDALFHVGASATAKILHQEYKS